MARPEGLEPSTTKFEESADVWRLTEIGHKRSSPEDVRKSGLNSKAAARAVGGMVGDALQPSLAGRKLNHFLNPCNHRNYPSQLKLIGMSKQP